MIVQYTLPYCYSMSHNKNTKGKGKQMSLHTMPCFRKNMSSSNEDVSLEEPIKDQQYSQESLNEINRVNKEKLRFQEDWPTKFKWLQEDLETGLLWCTYCRSDPHCKSLFGKTSANFFKTSALEEHARSVAHRDAILLQERDKNGLEKCASKEKASVDFTVQNLFKCA